MKKELGLPERSYFSDELLLLRSIIGMLVFSETQIVAERAQFSGAVFNYNRVINVLNAKNRNSKKPSLISLFRPWI